MRPILYSFRRCPYAIRARLALYYSGQTVELREVELKNKPAELSVVSAKATVPVLLMNDQIIDESLDIMQWALSQHDPEAWLTNNVSNLTVHELVQKNDHEFKPVLDKYKYFDRYPEFTQQHYFEQAKPYLEALDQRIQSNGGFLISNTFGAIDAALFPFVRQFAHVDLANFNQLEYSSLQTWLQHCLDSELFSNVMKKYPVWSSTESNSVLFG